LQSVYQDSDLSRNGIEGAHQQDGTKSGNNEEQDRFSLSFLFLVAPC